jgi:hypothetical protein
MNTITYYLAKNMMQERARAATRPDVQARNELRLRSVRGQQRVPKRARSRWFSSLMQGSVSRID